MAAAQAEQALALAVGDHGAEVEQLQEALVAQGEDLVVDGAFGPRTKAAVERAQRKLNLPVTGVADQALLDALGIVPPTPLVCTPAADPAAPAPVGKYLEVFPVAGGEYRYSDDFGAPRHQGSHQGIDILAERGTPIVAVAAGKIKRVSRSETGLGGVWIWFEDTKGNTFYYAHLDTILDGIQPGVAVTAGQQIATMGNTGDARFGAPHLHFEVHPGGGDAISGYTDLQAVDPVAAGGQPAAPAECTEAPPETPTPTPPPATTAPAPAEPVAPPPPPPPPKPRVEVAPKSKPAGAGPAVKLTVAQLRINQRISQAALRRINEVRARLGGPRATIKERPPGVVRLTVQQLLINQRISQAAVRRVRELEALFTDAPPAPLAVPDPGKRARAAALVSLTPRQLLINQRISQAAVRRINALLDRLPKPKRARKPTG